MSDHGKATTYERGCRCAECTAVHAAYMRDYRRRKRDPAGFKPNRIKAPLAAEEACRLAGVSYRQLDYWASKGWLDVEENPGSGKPRLYGPPLVARLKALKRASEMRQMTLPALADLLEGKPRRRWALRRSA